MASPGFANALKALMLETVKRFGCWQGNTKDLLCEVNSRLQSCQNHRILGSSVFGRPSVSSVKIAETMSRTAGETMFSNRHPQPEVFNPA